MGRSKKTETPKTEEAVNAEIQIEVTPTGTQEIPADQSASEPEEVKETSKPSKAKKVEEPTAQEKELMRLYSQYEKIWITPNGFVHPELTPEYMRRGAKLLTNIFYNK